MGPAGGLLDLHLRVIARKIVQINAVVCAVHILTTLLTQIHMLIGICRRIDVRLNPENLVCIIKVAVSISVILVLQVT